MNFGYFRAIQGLAGAKTLSDAKIAEVQDRLNREFTNSINYVSDAERNGKPQEFLIVSTQEQSKLKLYTRPGEDVLLGDTILWNGVHWLVTDISFNDTIYNYAVIEPCNRQIRWQNKEGDIIERWCMVEKPYTANMSTGEVLTTLNGRYNITLPYDDESKNIDVGKRFMLDIIDGVPKCYIVEFADTSSHRYVDAGGYIEWTCTSDEYNPNVDNIDKMICDYFEKPQQSYRIMPNSCAVNGVFELKYGSERTFHALFYDEYCKPTQAEPRWNVIVPNEKYYSYSVSDGELVLSCSPREQLIGDVIKVMLYDAEYKFKPCEFEVKIVPVYM